MTKWCVYDCVDIFFVFCCNDDSNYIWFHIQTIPDQRLKGGGHIDVWLMMDPPLSNFEVTSTCKSHQALPHQLRLSSDHQPLQQTSLFWVFDPAKVVYCGQTLSSPTAWYPLALILTLSVPSSPLHHFSSPDGSNTARRLGSSITKDGAKSHEGSADDKWERQRIVRAWRAAVSANGSQR